MTRNAIVVTMLTLVAGALPIHGVQANTLSAPLARIGAVAAPAPASPDGYALVVTSNLQEAFGEPDVANHDDMRVYVRRLTEDLANAPDVLLLQEVRDSSVRFVARLLGERFDSHYSVVVRPGAGWEDTATHVIDTETSVLINSETMSVVHQGGYVSTRYNSSDGAPGVKPKIKNHAVALVKQRSTGLRLAVASVHLVQNKFLRSWDIGNRYRRQWSRKIADALTSRYPRGTESDMFVVGGDFNSARCAMEKEICPLPFWRMLVGGYEYRDAHYELAKAHGVDFVFSTGGLVAAGSDQSYSPKREFYSDHRFRWAVVEAEY